MSGYFGKIPDEIKVKIFSYFTTKEISKCLAPVCAEWWILSKDPSLWKRIVLNICPEKPSDVYRQVIGRCETSLTSLTLHTTALRNELITYLSNFHLRKLKELELRGWRHINNYEMCNIAFNCPNVEILVLNVMSGTGGLFHISNLKNLKSLTICGPVYQNVQRPDVELILKMCTKLEALILQTLDRFDDKFLVQLAGYRNETLKHLVLLRDNLTVDGIRAITSCQNLTTLCMKGRVRFLSNEMLALLSTMQKLRWLNLGGTVGTEPQTWNNFFKSQKLSCLKILEITGTDIDDSGVVCLALTCKHLVILDLSRNYHVRDAGVQAVIDNCSQLWFLDVSCTQVTRAILAYIPNKLHRLRYLIVPVCSGIEGKVLKTFSLTCPRVEVGNELEGTDVEYRVDERLNVKWPS